MQNKDKKVCLFHFNIHSPIHCFTHLLIHPFNHSHIQSIIYHSIIQTFTPFTPCPTFASFLFICVYSLQTMLFGFINIIKMKKNLLLIFGLLGLVSLMAESGPKKSNLISMLGLDGDAACCDVTVCCQASDASCCDISNCCTTDSNCCTCPTDCCTSDAKTQTTSTTDGTANQFNVSCK
jgi:hypothetical protein